MTARREALGDSRPQGALVMGAAVVLSIAAVCFTTRQPVLVGVFAAGIAAFGSIAWAFYRPKPVVLEPEQVIPDWSVTVAAIDRPDCAVAIIDRAGRLVCANARFEEWFGTGQAPPRLPVDNPSLERMAKAGRAGWRDGRGQADVVEGPTGRWRAEALRAGRGDDYLVWTIQPLVASDPVAELVPHLTGKLGRALAQAGISAAIVDPDGKIRIASPGFALRAVGDAAALLSGEDFVSLLRQDERDRISWAR